MTIVGCKSTKFSGNNKEKEGKIYIFVQIPLRKAAIKREQHGACSNYAEREETRPKVNKTTF
jgi:hypothetical protein